MKKNILILITLCCFFFMGCKVERSFPSIYKTIEENFINENYESVIELLESSEINKKEKTDWYYFFYGVSLYKIGQWNSKTALRYLKIANAYNNKDYYISYYLGEILFDTKNYKKAVIYFEKCIKGNLKQSNFLNTNPILWLLITKIKLNNLNFEEFKNMINSENSKNIEKIISILETKTITTDDILYFIKSENLSTREKLLVIDSLLENKITKNLISTILSFTDLPSLFRQYFMTKLIYFNLSDTNECFNIMKKLNTSGDDSFLILDCKEYLIWEYFEKYCAFYYWLVNDYQKVNLSSQNYYYIRKRVNSYSITYATDLKLFNKEFKNDKEFLAIRDLKV